MRVLLLSRYGRRGASSRVRSYQYESYLRAAGIEITSAPLFDDIWLDRLYSGCARTPGMILRAGGRRLVALLAAARYDLLWIEYELFPWFPALLERLLSLSGRRYVVEFDDAVFHRYDRHPRGAIRLVLGRKIDQVMRGAAAVIAGNSYLAARARAAGAVRVECLPSVVDLDRYAPGGTTPGRVAPGSVAVASGGAAPEGTFTVGWIGSPATAAYLHEAAPALRELCRESGTRVTLVGAPRTLTLPGVGIEHRPWTEAGEVDEIRRFDVGIMPLADGPWEQGKCGYKLVQYMACAKAVVASPVGMNRELVRHGVNGFLASSPAEWIAALRTLRSDECLRTQLGQSGRQLVEAQYALQVTAPRLTALLRDLAPAGVI